MPDGAHEHISSRFPSVFFAGHKSNSPNSKASQMRSASTRALCASYFSTGCISPREDITGVIADVRNPSESSRLSMVKPASDEIRDSNISRAQKNKKSRESLFKTSWDSQNRTKKHPKSKVVQTHGSKPFCCVPRSELCWKTQACSKQCNAETVRPVLEFG